MNFADFADGCGLQSAHYINDGKVHRCPTKSHPRKRNGAYRLDGDWGWCQDWAVHEKPMVWRRMDGVVPEHQKQIYIDKTIKWDDAAKQAESVICKCSTSHHPYLERKGFPTSQCLTDFDGRMVIPMRSCVHYGIQSLQWIAASGEKKFMPGGRAKGAIFRLGSASGEQWLCEGYATGLSVQSALGKLYRRACVVVCFSAGNLGYVAERLKGRLFVCADNDVSGTGERVARSTGLPWVMPTEIGMDANDVHQKCGVFELAELLRKVL